MENLKYVIQKTPSYIWVILFAFLIIFILYLIHLKAMNKLLAIMNNEDKSLSEREEAGYELLNIASDPFFIEEVRKTAEQSGMLQLAILARERLYYWQYW